MNLSDSGMWAEGGYRLECRSNASSAAGMVSVRAAAVLPTKGSPKGRGKADPVKGKVKADGDGAVATHRRIRVLLADDHPVVREGLARLLQMQADIEIVGQAADGQRAVEMAHELEPDVVIMDVSMPIVGGIEATRQIHGDLPRIGVIGLSMHSEREVATAMYTAGRGLS